MAAKKGKSKAQAPATAQVPTATVKAKKESKKSATPTTSALEHDILIFDNEKAKRAGPSRAVGSVAGVCEAPSEAPKPTVKQIIGGHSWTGKLPVNLLSEHCQKQKWDRPDYHTTKTPDGFSVLVSLAARNAKTGEVSRLPHFKLPPSHVHLAYKPTALEAKHTAATYALYRVCSMKNLHMMLPPEHKALWKELEALKKQDVKDGKAWMYEADPFQTMREREEAKAASEKKRQQQQDAREKAANAPGTAMGTQAPGGGSGSHGLIRGWTTVPRIEMGNRTRAILEDILRRETIWNPHGLVMDARRKEAIVKEFGQLGFRPSHIQEAVEECKDREETLEWLLIHVPEDDLPRWALPEKYSAGLTVGATDLRREGAIKRLAQSGYSADLCRQIYDGCGRDEGRAAEELQQLLLGSGSGSLPGATLPEPDDPGRADSSRSPDECWDEEMASLEASFGLHFSRPSQHVCQIRIESVTNGRRDNVETFVQFRRSHRYPDHVILSMVADLAAYIKLSIIKKALAYMIESLQGEEMKTYFVASWVQENINGLIEKPGLLRDVAAVASAASEPSNPIKSGKTARRRPHPDPIIWTPDMESKRQWQARQETSRYRNMLCQRAKLPAWQAREEIIWKVSKNQVIIISGETGSGKSTQSVQFILDDLYSKGLGTAANMVVTQPRRISALSLADRVSEERCTQVGQEVGYVIRGESRSSDKTRITFVTTGVLLRRLQTSGGRTDDVVASLANVSHLVMDEVHERSLDTDFLLTIVRDVLSRRRDLKLILMSATLDVATFRDYFLANDKGLSVGTVEIPGRTFPVDDYYLDDIIVRTGFPPGYGKDSLHDSHRDGDGERAQARDAVNKIIQRLGSRINYDLLVETVRAIDQDLMCSKETVAGAILVFLPGLAEIKRACDGLRSLASLHVLPLHASLETREQKKVFASPPPGKRKVVVATNVAETSITIDDIVAVIDSGRVKETSFDAQTNMRKLEETWASRAACKQRRGRAGRVRAGKCYKLYTRHLEQTQMADRPDPEIRRVPLEQICLSVMAMGIRDVADFLARAPTPPEAVAVQGAVKMLRRMGALDGDELTALGQQLALIPADLRCGKLMVFGAIFGCLHECVSIAAILSTRSPFLSPAEKRAEAREARMRFARGDGDLLTDLRAFQDWDQMIQNRRIPQSHARSFCETNFLSHQTLSDIASTRTQYLSSLSEIGIPTDQAASKPCSSTLLRALTASAFAPQIARIQFPDKKFATSMSGAVELDPEAKTIRYYTPENGRVFVHPSSTLFDSQSFPANAVFLSYFTIMATSKTFIRDLTPFNSYTLLLFSGAIELDTQGRGLSVDGWLRLRGWARIGVLVSRLRAIVDKTIAMKLDDPALDVKNSSAIKAAVKLIEWDGLDA